MKRRKLLIAGCALLLAGAMSAQNRSAAVDPVSGTWNGSMGPSETSRAVITLRLKYDGKSAVTGTITGPQIAPGDIKTGTFDAKTGALKFKVVVQGDGSVVDFAGALANGAAEGRLSGDIGDGTFKITKGTGAATSAVAQAAIALPPADDASAAAARRGFTEVNGWLARAADLIPADKYAYKPAPTVRTVGQMLGHAIDGYQFYCNRAAGREVQWTSAAEKGPADKATIVQKLKDATAVCNTAYAGKGEIAPLIENIGHTSLHYGNIVTYMRMMGLVPPSS